jgi:hypothetical protein
MKGDPAPSVLSKCMLQLVSASGVGPLNRRHPPTPLGRAGKLL